MDNIDKALTAYYLDTGSYPVEAAAGNGLLETRELTASAATGWLGPYLTFSDGATADLLDHSTYGEIGLYRSIDGAWSDVEDAGSECLSGSTSCSVFVCYSSIPDDIAAAIDEKIDGSSAAATTGNFRYSTGNPACKKGIVYDKTLAPTA